MCSDWICGIRNDGHVEAVYVWAHTPPWIEYNKRYWILRARHCSRNWSINLIEEPDAQYTLNDCWKYTCPVPVCTINTSSSTTVPCETRTMQDFTQKNQMEIRTKNSSNPGDQLEKPRRPGHIPSLPDVDTARIVSWSQLLHKYYWAGHTPELSWFDMQTPWTSFPQSEDELRQEEWARKKNRIPYLPHVF